MKIKILQMNTKNFWKKTAKLLKNVLNKLNEINSVLNKNKNIKNKNSQLINLIEEISKNNIKSNIDKISNVILKEFEDIIPLIKKEKPKKIITLQNPLVILHLFSQKLKVIQISIKKRIKVMKNKIIIK